MSLRERAAEPRDGCLQDLGADSDAMGYGDRDIGAHTWEPTKIPRGINRRAPNLRGEYRCELFHLRQQVSKLGCSFGGWFLRQGGLRLLPGRGMIPSVGQSHRIVIAEGYVVGMVPGQSLQN